jgi:mannose-6-phosphate isomerase-like protein (cupin superfamily)
LTADSAPRPYPGPARAVRRITTGLDNSGHSTVYSDDLAPGPGEDLWRTSSDQPLGSDLNRNGREPPQGGTRWGLFTIAPGETAMHRTNTIDYVYVMSSGLSLVLEDGEVPLNVGECIVQRATPHGWRNRGDHVAQILCVMISLTAVDGLASSLSCAQRSGR